MSKLFSDKERTLLEASQKYYTDGTSPLSDAEFDKLENEIRNENPSSKVLRVGYGYDINKDTTPGEKVKHRYGTVGSLDKIHNVSELPDHMLNHLMRMSLKLDGLSVVLYYDRGVFVQAVTRGDGEIGIDITNKAKTILEDEYDIFIPGFTGAIRGEILMSFEQFERFKQTNPTAPNPRNAAAGLINRKEWSKDPASYLDIVVYHVIGSDDTFGDANYNPVGSHDGFLRDHFTRVVPITSFILTSNMDTDFHRLRDEWYSEYPADGIVITHPQAVYNQSNGSFQFDEVAYKFPPEEKETTVLGIEWNMSKTGYAIPRIHVEPVQLAGTTVEYTAGFNAMYIKDTGIGIGSKVTIAKMGEIIPNITSVISKGMSNIPSICPSCGQSLRWKGVHLACTNRKCPNIEIQDMLVWIQSLVPTDGIGETLIVSMMNTFLPFKKRSVESIWYCGKLIDPNKGIQTTRFVEMWNKMFEGPFTLESAIRALNIPRFGEKTAAKLSQHPDAVKAALNISSIDDLDRILSSIIGTADLESLKENFNRFLRLRFIDHLIDWSDPTESGEIIQVAITGKLSIKRSEFEKLLKKNGFQVGNITKNTQILITDNPNSNSAKNQQAEKLGIKRMTESEFRSLYNI